jgi:hypothetical protein
MTLDQIDRALAEWQARLAQAGSSLLELDDSAAYQRLRGTVDTPPAKLTGLTQTRVGPALALIDGLWQSQQQLTDIVNQAERLRPALKRLWAHDAEQRQIEFLLFGASAQLPSAEVPFAQRGLLPEPQSAQAITPDQLLAQMTQNFAVVKKTVLALQSAWNRLEPACAAAEREVADLLALAGQLGVSPPSTLDTVRRELAALQNRAAADPLGASADTAPLTELLVSVRTQLVALKQQQDKLETDLHRANTLLSQIDALQESCEAVLADCRAKIDGFSQVLPPLPLDLPGWLQSVEAARQNRQWKSVQIGLERWFQAAEDARARLAGFRKTSSALLERREELRGLLSALQAKAAAQAYRGAMLDPSLPEVASDAERLLHGRPTPLNRAAALVTEYERRLAG